MVTSQLLQTNNPLKKRHLFESPICINVVLRLLRYDLFSLPNISINDIVNQTVTLVMTLFGLRFEPIN